MARLHSYNDVNDMRRPIVTDIKKTGRGEGSPSILRGVVIDTRVATGMCRVRLDNLSKRTIKNVIIPVGEDLQSGDVVLLANLGQDPRWVIITKMQEGSDIGQHLSPTNQGATQLHPPNNLSVTGIDGAVKAEWDCWAGNTVCWEVQHNSSATDTDASTRYTRGAYFFYHSSTAVTRHIRVRAVRYDVELNQAYYSAWSAWSSATSTIPIADDADTVDGFHASDTPIADWLLALDSNAQFPSEVIPSMLGPHTFGGHTDKVGIGSDGTLTLYGDARVKKEFTIGAVNLDPGNQGPDAVILSNTLGYSYDIGDDSVMSFEVPYDCDTSEDIKIEIYWYINEARTGSNEEVQWRCRWSACPADASEAIDAPTHSGTIDFGDQLIPTVAKYLTEVSGIIAAASIDDGDFVSMTIDRVALDGGTNPTADPVIVQIEVEYTMNKLGKAV